MFYLNLFPHFRHINSSYEYPELAFLTTFSFLSTRVNGLSGFRFALYDVFVFASLAPIVV